MNKYTLIVFIFIFVNCQNNQQKPDINRNTKPLFLDLYPSMSEEEFNSKLTEYENSGILSNDKFNIIVNNYKLPFKISYSGGNGSDCISLDYEQIFYKGDFGMPSNFFNKEISKNLKKNIKNRIKGLVEIFEKKYPNETNILGLKELSTKTIINDKHPFYKYMLFYNSGSDYIIFRDSTKTVELVYRIGGNEKLIYNNSNSEIISSILVLGNLNNLYKIKVTNDLNKLEEDVILKFTPIEKDYLLGRNVNLRDYNPNYKKEYEKAIKKYGPGDNIIMKGTENNNNKVLDFSISINYYYNKTYDSMVKDARNSKIHYDEKIKDKIKEKNIKINILKKNTDKL